MRFGIDQLEDVVKPMLKGSRFGVLCHPASVDRQLLHLVPRLRALGLAPSILFGPEHGFDGQAQDMIAVGDARDQHGTPVRSLYGDTFADLSPRPEDMHGLDVLLIDLQDIGSRYYTFVWTALLAARVAFRAGVRVCVLDRPNPLGSVRVEGALQAFGFSSFVGLEPTPVRHGLTLGDLLRWRAQVEKVAPEALSVVRCLGVGDAITAKDWDRPWVLPSPNMPTFDTAWVYPGGCLLEGTNLSEGRGTTRPFELFGAPWLDADALARAALELGLPDVGVRPCTFLPTFHKFGGTPCRGLQVHPRGPAFQPVRTYAALIALAHHLHPEHFQFRTERYEYVDDIPAFDLLTGSAKARLAILGGASAREVGELASVVAPADLDQFRGLHTATW
jgi:uncharacterized protein YbbC (DUF1343 family)